MIPLMVAASALQGFSSLFKGFSANSALRSQATALDKKAEATRMQTGLEAALTLEAGRRQAGEVLVNAAANGGGTGGSALEVLKDLERQITFQSKNQVIEGENQARVLNYNAQVARKQGKIELIGGVLNAGASFLNAGAQMKGK